jgi:hypothetical protein
VPNCGRNPEDVENQNRNHAKFACDNVESFTGMRRNGLVVQSRNQSKAEVEHVEKDEEEQNYTGDSLNQVKPVARIRIGEVVGPRFHCNHQPVNGVVD